MPRASSNEDLLLSIGIDTVSLNQAKQTIQRELGGIMIPVSISGVNQASLIRLTQQIGTASVANERLVREQLRGDQQRIRNQRELVQLETAQERLGVARTRRQQTEGGDVLTEQLHSLQQERERDTVKALDDRQKSIDKAIENEFDAYQRQDMEVLRNTNKRITAEQRMRNKSLNERATANDKFEDEQTRSDWEGQQRRNKAIEQQNRLLQRQSIEAEKPSRTLAEFGKALKWAVIFTIVYTGIRTLKAAIGGVSQEFIVIDDAINILRRDLNLASNEMGKGLTQALLYAEATAVKYGQAVADVIMVQDKFAKQGKSLPDIMTLTEATLVGAATAMITAQEAAQILSTTMLTFGLSAGEAIGVFDRLNEVSKKFNITAKDLGAALQHTGGSARQAGVTLDQTIGLITVIAEATGRAGAEIGNSLRTLSSFVYRPETVKGLERMGIAVQLADKSYRKLGDILGTVVRKWETMTDAEQENIIQLMAGTLRREQFLAIVENYPKALSASAASAGSFGGALSEMAIRMDTVSFHADRLRGAFGSLANDMGNAFGLKTGSIVFLDIISAAFVRLGQTMRGVTELVREAFVEINAEIDRFIMVSAKSGQALDPALQTYLFISKVLAQNKTISKDLQIDIEKEILRLQGLTSIEFSTLTQSKDFRATLIQLAGDVYSSLAAKIPAYISTQEALNDKLILTKGRLEDLLDLSNQPVSPFEDLQKGLKGIIELYKSFTLSPPSALSNLLERVSGKNYFITTQDRDLINSMIESLKTKIQQGGQGVTDATNYLNLIKDIQVQLGKATPDVDPLYKFRSDALDAYMRKKEEMIRIYEQYRDTTKSTFDEELAFNTALLAIHDALIDGYKQEIIAIEKKAEAENNRNLEEGEQRNIAERRLRIALELVDQEGLVKKLKEQHRVQLLINTDMNALIEIAKPLRSIFGDTEQQNLAEYQSELSTLQSQLKAIIAARLNKPALSPDDLALQKKENEIRESLLETEKAILKTKGDIFLSDLNVRRSQLRGATQEDALWMEIERLQSSGSVDKALETTKELINYQYGKAEALVSTVSDGISSGMISALKAAPGEVNNAFRSMFDSIFTEIADTTLKEQLKPLIAPKLVNMDEWTIVSNMIKSSIEIGGRNAAILMGRATGQNVDVSLPTTKITGPAIGDETWFQKYGGTASVVALSAMQGAQTGNMAPTVGSLIGSLIGNAISPGAGGIIGSVLGGLVGSLFGKKKKQEPTPVKDPMLEIVHRDLEYVNRNLVALRKPMELFALPASYYFSQRPSGGVQVQGVTINVYGIENNAQMQDTITNAVAQGFAVSAKRVYQGVA